MVATDTGWTPADLPDQSGRTFVVTGANSGLGLAATRLLAQAGAEVVMGSRSPERARAAADTVYAVVPHARLHLRALDLADLASVAAFAEGVAADFPRVDALLNNAGIMMTAPGRTRDGFETQLGVNHLGHFALTLRLLPHLARTPGARVVTVSSVGHRSGKIVLNDLMFDRRRYRRFAAYGQSKLANLLFTAELDRRLTAAQLPVLAVAAHPGFSRTELGQNEGIPGFALLTPTWRWLSQSAEAGTMPTLRAATDPGVRGNDYFGPAHRGQSVGPAVRVGRSASARDTAMAAALWQRSLELTGVPDSTVSTAAADLPGPATEPA